MNEQELREEIVRLNARVVKLERQVEFLMGQAQGDFQDRIEDQYAEVVRLKRQGNVLGAIKLYREQTNSSLAEAKSFVESL